MRHSKTRKSVLLASAALVPTVAIHNDDGEFIGKMTTSSISGGFGKCHGTDTRGNPVRSSSKQLIAGTLVIKTGKKTHSLPASDADVLFATHLYERTTDKKLKKALIDAGLVTAESTV